MGNYGSSAASASAERIATASLEQIDAKRDDLGRRQRRHNEQAECLMSQARAHRASNNREAAVACLRQRQQMREQATAIGNMMTTLDAHARSIETKLITSEVMAVMKSTAKQLSKGAMNASSVDDFMIQNSEAHEDMLAVSHAMSQGDVVVDEEELYKLLDTPADPVPGGVPAQTTHDTTGAASVPAQTTMVSFNDDAAFVADIEAQITALVLPSVPTKDIEAVTRPPPPPPHYTAQAGLGQPFNL